MKPIWQNEEETDVLEDTEENKMIVLYNDPINTFQHVIECLVAYCEHSPEQAEQCATIVHHNGKVDVKHGSFEKLIPVYEALIDNKLSAKIE